MGLCGFCAHRFLSISLLKIALTLSKRRFVFLIIGLVFLFSTVFGGYIVAGGSMAPFFTPLPTNY